MRGNIVSLIAAGLVLSVLSMAILIFDIGKSLSSDSDDEMNVICHVSFSGLSKLYKCSLKEGDLQEQFFALSGIIKLYETSYNSNLETKIITSTDAGLAYARRWLIFEKFGEVSNAEKDFNMSTKLLEKRYGDLNKENMKKLITEVDSQLTIQ